MRMKIDGTCHCGSISFEADVDPDNAILCHCTDCQKISGAPCRACVPVLTENFKLKGGPKIYVKTADSGAKRAQAFCGECGAPIYSAAVVNPTVVHLRLGALQQRSEIVPRRQIWRASALDWRSTSMPCRRRRGSDRLARLDDREANAKIDQAWPASEPCRVCRARISTIESSASAMTPNDTPVVAVPSA